MISPVILYEDDNILAINKPAGLVVHGDGRTKEPSVSEWFINKYPESKNVGEPLGAIARPGIVHRLDRDTSGAMLLAKSNEGYDILKEQFGNREIEKIYHAFLYGNLKEDHGTINKKISRSKSDFRKRIVSAPRSLGEVGREAVTYFQVLKRGADATLVEAKPKTGRTHQIRVHFKALHHPVVGDKLYAAGKSGVLGFTRLALHARQLKFKNAKGEEVLVKAPYPEDFKSALDSIGFSVLD